MNKTKNYPLLGCLIATPAFIYFYFLKWKNITLHDDDLSVFKDYSGLNTFSAKLHRPPNFGKFRPIHDFVLSAMMQLFGHNFDAYYLFNIGIQTINTFIFALILNLFLKSPLRSLFFAILVGITRFSIYNVSQLVFGGAMEGIAMTFFLLCVFFLVKVVLLNDLTNTKKRYCLFGSILFANLCMYTHERYIVLLPFIALIMFFFPGFKTFTLKQRIGFGALAILSIALNFILKQYLYSMPLLVGTADSTISFSFSTAFSFLINAVSSIFLINSGPEYLAGFPFSSLPLPEKAVVILLFIIILFILASFLFKVLGKEKIFSKKQAIQLPINELQENRYLKTEDYKVRFFIFLSLGVLFFMLLVPAVVSVRLELRWLQASFSLLVLMIVIALSSLHFKNNSYKNILYSLFILSFIWADHNYLRKGTENLYFNLSAKIAETFNKAINAGTIRANTTNLYLLEKHRNPDRENEINWSLGGAYFFDFVQHKNKNMIYTDSVYKMPDSATVVYIPGFNRNTDQVIFLNIQNTGSTFAYTITDVTDQYLKDSLRNFNY